MNTAMLLKRLAGASCALALLAGGQAWAQGYSHARIVRLSFVEGTVTIQRPGLLQWAEAPVNTPLQEGFKLATAENGFAEVEFEDASTARIGQLTSLEFNQLVLEPTGGKVNRITLQQGYATFHVTPGRGDLYEVRTATATLDVHLETPTMFRVDLDGDLLRVEVFKGLVDVSSIFGARTVGQDRVLELRPGSAQPERESAGITTDAWDEWVEQREKQAVPLESRRAPGLYSNDVSTLLYGWNDLWNYGTWSSIPGYGSAAWVPRVPLGWVPYSIGRWCWYPGFGYTWISGEPWGWLPYHYGQWIFHSGIGWCWIPGSFGAWSPGAVTWYQGPGWIGWAPRSPFNEGGVDGCPPEQRCHTFVHIDAFGKALSANATNSFSTAPSGVQPVGTPEVLPSQLPLLPGPVVPQVSGQAGARTTGAVGTAGNRNSLIAGSPPSPPSTQPAVVFDPLERRFVNNPAASPEVVERNAPTGQARVARPHSTWSSSTPDTIDPVTSGSVDGPEPGFMGARSGSVGRAAPPTPTGSAPARSPQVFGQSHIFNSAPPASSPTFQSAPSTPNPTGSPSRTYTNSAPAPSYSAPTPSNSAPASGPSYFGKSSAPPPATVSSEGGPREAPSGGGGHSVRER